MRIERTVEAKQVALGAFLNIEDVLDTTSIDENAIINACGGTWYGIPPLTGWILAMLRSWGR